MLRAADGGRCKGKIVNQHGDDAVFPKRKQVLNSRSKYCSPERHENVYEIQKEFPVTPGYVGNLKMQTRSHNLHTKNEVKLANEIETKDFSATEFDFGWLVGLDNFWDFILGQARSQGDNTLVNAELSVASQ